MSVKPPRPMGPPLNALRAFEAAARLGGFSRAAEELCVTPGAVAQQIKQLEDWAGAPFFDRQAQGVQLNALGRQLLPMAERAFDQIADLAQGIRVAASPNRIHIAALPAVAQLWLSPRLPALRQKMPELEISVTALEEPPNLEREPYDLSVFYMPDGKGQALVADQIQPVCAPSLAAQLQRPEDLSSCLCLVDSVWANDWSHWLKEGAGLPELSLRGPTYSLYSLAVQEAVNGAGVLMGHESLIAPLLKAGRLVAPFKRPVATGLALSLEMRQPVRDPLARFVSALKGA